MKRMLALLFLMLFCTHAAKSQQPNPERRHVDWKPNAELSWQSKLDDENKTDMINSIVRLARLSYTKTDNWGDTTLTRVHGFAPNKTYNYRYFGFKVQRNQRLSKRINLFAGARVDFTQMRRSGYAFGGIEYTFGKLANTEDRPALRTAKAATLFSRIDLSFPLELRDNIENGLMWSNGMEAQLENSKVMVQPNVRLITDTGTIINGKRAIVNVGFTACYKVKTTCIGGGIDHWRLVSGQFERKQSTMARLFVRYN